MSTSLPIYCQQCQTTVLSNNSQLLTQHDNVLPHNYCCRCHKNYEKLSISQQDKINYKKEPTSILFQTINESQTIRKEINNNDQSLLSKNNNFSMTNDNWPGDRIFDKQCSSDYCIKRYDDYLADLMSKSSGLPITSNELPNIAPCNDIVIDHMHTYERCSVQCIANEHVLSCFHSSRFFGSKMSRSLSSIMKPRCPEGKRFLIIGGGPAGLFMAIQCLLRGHAVRLIEQRTVYNRAVACGLLETEKKFFQFIGLPSCFFLRATNDAKNLGVYVADIEELMMKILMKMGGLIYLGCQFEPNRQIISSYSQSKPGIRCWDGLSVDQEIYTDYDVLVYATGNTKSIPLDLFKMKPSRLSSQIFQEFDYLWSSNFKPSFWNNLSAVFRRIFCQKHLCLRTSRRISPSCCSSHDRYRCFSSIKEFLLDTSYDGGAMIVQRLKDKTIYLDDWLQNVKQEHILSLSEHPLLAMVAHIPASVFVSKQPQKQVNNIPVDWIFIPCFVSSESINNNEIHTIQFEGPLPIHYHRNAKQFPVYRFFTSLLQNYLNVSLNENQWHDWCQQDVKFKNYSQRSIRAFPQQFETLLQYRRLNIKRQETGEIIFDYEQSKCSMWGYFKDPINSTQKEFLIIGDSLCSPYYRFGIGLHNATRTTLSYFHSDPNERLRQMLDVEISLVKQIILTLFSQSFSLNINQSDSDFIHLIKSTLQNQFEDNMLLHGNYLHN
ncbi:unnamed protein product [Rotaria sp. Silwood1]|nr:unnamed protein product [Rotaria sp. Silwood1]CAF1362037.1 unnamed protein product [Rotaria sp. Silwood1]CAF1363082.1 unnamed protein product [Rotaria sp. Silwood1]CAF3533177.1 unnamed protein product [Rotaria sp. Silwood1]CAF3555510.1 unnamed protein product [Rotaria sp. Silwood1]